MRAVAGGEDGAGGRDGVAVICGDGVEFIMRKGGGAGLDEGYVFVQQFRETRRQVAAEIVAADEAGSGEPARNAMDGRNGERPGIRTLNRLIKSQQLYR